MEARIESRIGTLDTRVTDLGKKFTGKIDALDKKFSDKLDVMGRDVADVRERTARVEGHLMAPEGFTLRTFQPPSAVDPPPAPERPSEDPATDQQQAG